MIYSCLCVDTLCVCLRFLWNLDIFFLRRAWYHKDIYSGVHCWLIVSKLSSSECSILCRRVVDMNILAKASEFLDNFEELLLRHSTCSDWSYGIWLQVGRSGVRSMLYPMQWHSCWFTYPYKMNFSWVYFVYLSYIS